MVDIPEEHKEAFEDLQARIERFKKLNWSSVTIEKSVKENTNYDELRKWCANNGRDFMTGELIKAEIETQSAQPGASVELEWKPEIPQGYQVTVLDREGENYKYSQATATYRFVPVSADLVPSSVEQRRTERGWRLASINEPLKEGYCAEIDFTLEAEAPLLVGRGKENDVVMPVDLGNSSNPHWAIPGATLRGLLRSAFETIGYSRLTQFNRKRFFALRDFDHLSYGKEIYPVTKMEFLAAGWIRIKTDPGGQPLYNGDYPVLQFHDLTVDGWHPIKADALLYEYGVTTVNEIDFTRMSLTEKYTTLGMAKADVFDFTDLRSYTLGDAEFGKRRAQLSGGFIKFSGVPVCGGAAPELGEDKRKKLEYVFKLPPDNANWMDLPEAVVTEFVEVNSSRVGDRIEPNESWAAVLPTLNAGGIIPVFHVGKTNPPRTLAQLRKFKSGEAPFAMGLTRLFRVPHAYSFLEAVEAAAGPTLPAYKLEENGARLTVVRESPLDQTEALFGYVYEPHEVLGIPREQAKELSSDPGDFALKGRVAFSAARLDESTPAELSPETECVLSTPRPSFAPFYLSGKWKDYSPPVGTPKIAGKKAYLPRYSGKPFSEIRKSVEKNMAITCQRPQNGELRGPPEKDRPLNPDTVSKLSFLLPSDENRLLQFKGKIRFFNVTKEEIGGILWALTHGGNQDRCRHMIGHARSLGAGQVRVAEVSVHAERNDTAGETAETATDFMQAFEAYMEEKLRNTWRNGPVVQRFLDAADPAKGAALDGHLPANQFSDPLSEGKLQSMLLANFAKVRKLTQPRPVNPNKKQQIFKYYENPPEDPLIDY